MKGNPFLVLFLILFTSSTKAQVIVDSGDLLVKISNYISNIPGTSGNDYTNPSVSERDSWSTAITALTGAEYSASAAQANSLGYDLIEFTDTTTNPTNTYYILSPNSSNHWGLYVFNPSHCRNLVIQAPHPQKDFNTGKQGAFVFKETQSLWLCIAGTNRCNHAAFSSCDGTTSICSGNSESYRISDVAHNAESIFQTTTDIILNQVTDSYFIQLHGFSKLSTDPYVILSNGTRDTPSLDYLVSFQNELYREDNSLNFKTAHIDVSWTRLTGFTNTQGRLINGSTNPCKTSSTSTSGRFFHIEQEKTKLRDDAMGWSKISNALVNTFNCETLTLEKKTLEKLQIYPNPASNFLVLQARSSPLDYVLIYNMLGQNVNKSVEIIQLDEMKIRIGISELPQGFYFLKTQKSAAQLFYKM